MINMIGVGILFGVIGCIALLTSIRKTKTDYYVPKKKSFQIKSRDFRIFNFVITYGTVVVSGFIAMYVIDYIFGKHEPQFYQTAIPGLFFGALFFALMNSLEFASEQIVIEGLPNPRKEKRSEPLEVLQFRFAKGEITKVKYEETKKVLDGEK